MLYALPHSTTEAVPLIDGAIACSCLQASRPSRALGRYTNPSQSHQASHGCCPAVLRRRLAPSPREEHAARPTLRQRVTATRRRAVSNWACAPACMQLPRRRDCNAPSTRQMPARPAPRLLWRHAAGAPRRTRRRTSPASSTGEAGEAPTDIIRRGGPDGIPPMASLPHMQHGDGNTRAYAVTRAPSAPGPGVCNGRRSCQHSQRNSI